MTNDYRSFLGVRVVGDINESSGRVAQRPLSELEPLIRAVLNDPGIDSFGWTQYTPYFNDGEPCVFGVGEVWVKPVGEGEEKADENEDDEEYEDEEENERLGMRYNSNHPLGNAEWEYYGHSIPRKRRISSHEGPDRERYMRCWELSEAISSGEFDDVLLEAFGDHATIKVSARQITVDHYEHE